MCSYHCFTISLCELNCIVNICVPIDIHVCGYVLVYVFFLFEEGGWWRERYTLGVGIYFYNLIEKGGDLSNIKFLASLVVWL